MSAKDMIEAARRRDNLGWLGIWPDEIDDRTMAGRRHLVARLRLVCQEERARCIGPDYSLARHNAAIHYYKQELAELRALEREMEPA